MRQKSYTYKLRTFIKASHAVRWQGVLGAEHPHTWELILEIRPTVEQFTLKFEDIEAVIADSIAPFHGQLLNNVQPFDQIVPTPENFAEQLFDLLADALTEIACQLHDLSVGESPTRYYSVALRELND